MKFLQKTILSPFYGYSIHKRLKSLDVKIQKNEEIQKIRDYKAQQSIAVNFYKNLFFTNKESGLNNKEIRDKKITISLTTYSYRIFDVYLTIESLLNQSVKPDRIILWLADDEFTLETIPNTLKQQISRGLEVKFCNDVMSYKKLIPALKEFPNDIIITADDDIMYPIDFIERLYSAYSNNSNLIYCYRARMISEDKSKLYDYNYWKNTKFDKPSLRIVPIGVGGVLYTADCFCGDILKEELFMTLAPKADDIWFKAMSLLANKKCQLITRLGSFEDNFISIPNSQEIALCNTNLRENKNNIQIKAVFDHYNIKV